MRGAGEPERPAVAGELERRRFGSRFATALSLLAAVAVLSYSHNASSLSLLWSTADRASTQPNERVAEHVLLQQIARAFLQEPWLLPDQAVSDLAVVQAAAGGDVSAPTAPAVAAADGGASSQPAGSLRTHAEHNASVVMLPADPSDLASVVLPPLGVAPTIPDDDEAARRTTPSPSKASGDVDEAGGGAPADEGAGVGEGFGLGEMEVEAHGETVAIEYVGTFGHLSVGGRYVTLCSGDWICVSGWHSRRAESRFELLRALVPPPGAAAAAASAGNTSGGAKSREGGAAISGGGWFALRSLSNGRLLQV